MRNQGNFSKTPCGVCGQAKDLSGICWTGGYAECVDGNNRHIFLAFRKKLYRAHPHKHVHVLVDNLPPMSTRMSWNGSLDEEGLTLHFTATHASWLNQIEIWFHILSQDVVKGGSGSQRRNCSIKSYSPSNDTTGTGHIHLPGHIQAKYSWLKDSLLRNVTPVIGTYALTPMVLYLVASPFLNVLLLHLPCYLVWP
jgi:hypothetical protein